VHTFHGHVLDGYFSPWASALIAMVERALARVTTAIITLSPRLEVELRERFRIAPANRFRIIPLGRELGALESCAERRGELRAELGLGAEVPLIGCVGRLVPIKDHHTLLEAFAGLSCEVPARLVIVGDGQLGPALEAQAEQLGVGARVHFLGWRSDLPGIYADLDLLALSSRNEGTPLAIIEAFAAGCPVVATRVGGVADLFSDALADEPLSSQARVERRAEGSLVEPGDPEALRAALAAWIADPTGRLRAASAARVAGRQYRAETLAERMAQLYRELLARKEPA
jgi:glycosyltransferase involved in cell wall biosynthesis